MTPFNPHPAFVLASCLGRSCGRLITPSQLVEHQLGDVSLVLKHNETPKNIAQLLLVVGIKLVAVEVHHQSDFVAFRNGTDNGSDLLIRLQQPLRILVSNLLALDLLLHVQVRKPLGDFSLQLAILRRTLTELLQLLAFFRDLLELRTQFSFDLLHLIGDRRPQLLVTR